MEYDLVLLASSLKGDSNRVKCRNTAVQSFQWRALGARCTSRKKRPDFPASAPSSLSDVPPNPPGTAEGSRDSGDGPVAHNLKHGDVMCLAGVKNVFVQGGTNDAEP